MKSWLREWLGIQDDYVIGLISRMNEMQGRLYRNEDEMLRFQNALSARVRDLESCLPAKRRRARAKKATKR